MKSLSSVHIIVFNGDNLDIGVLDLLFSEILKDDWQFSIEGDNHDNVPSIFNEGFVKIFFLVTTLQAYMLICMLLS
jgi:condensin complex subunit 3